ncbi:HMR1 protein, partial [Menura novaehollandiae]|nr:HMR1 protein [Menura novaehollandiae]
VLHSLRYLQVAVSEPSPGVPQFVSMEYLDGIPFDRYDSKQGRTEPQMLWMAAVVELGYWDRTPRGWDEGLWVSIRLWGSVGLEWVSVGLGHNSIGLHGSNPTPPGLHTIQWVCGCDLLSNGSIRGSHQYGCDGWDFISFQLGSGSFVADGAAQVTKRYWETDESWAEDLTNYLGHTCVEWLQKFIGYGQEVLEHK